MKNYLPVWVCILLLSQGCVRGQNSQVQQNDKIDPKVKTSIAALNKQAYDDMSANDYDKLSTLFSDTLKLMMSENFVKKFMPSMQHVMKGHSYKVMDEFYIKNTKWGDSVGFASGSGDVAYTYFIKAQNNETYVSMLVAGDVTDEIMLTLTWGNNKGKWQLNNITGEDYRLNNKNAIDLYHNAQALEKKGYLVDAINTMGLANHCARPGGRFFKFNKEPELAKYSDTLTAHVTAKYKLPYTITEMATKPSVVNIHYEADSGNYVPLIVYQSVINVADSSAVSKENLEMQAKIGRIFYGMDKCNKKLFYRVYNVLPDGHNDPRYFGYIQHL